MRPSARLSLLCAALAFAPLASPRHAAAQTAVPAVAGDYESVTGSATVAAIDPATRTVTLRDADGASVAVTAGDEVRNFDQIKVGDTVNATYAQSVHYKLYPAGSKLPNMVAASAAGAAKPGAKPGAAAGSETEVTFSILSVDTAANTLDVIPQGGGRVHTLHVQDPARQALLKTVQPGQFLTVTYTQAFALTVQPAKM